MKTSKAYRLSDKALANLRAICEASGVNETAAVEMALAALAKGLTEGDNKMATEQITNKTTLSHIQELVKKDFGVSINKGTAKEIKSQSADGCVIWTPKNLRTTSGIVIVPGKQIA